MLHGRRSQYAWTSSIPTCSKGVLIVRLRSLHARSLADLRHRAASHARSSFVRNATVPRDANPNALIRAATPPTLVTAPLPKTMAAPAKATIVYAIIHALPEVIINL